MTRLPLLVFVALALAAGCTRAALARLVPKLELRGELARDARATPALASDERLHANFSARLKWQPEVPAQAVLAPLELTPSAWLAPCALDDADCLTEVAEVERDVADALYRSP